MRNVAAFLVAILASTAASAGPTLPPEAAVVATLDNHPTVSGAGERVAAARSAADMLSRGPYEFTVQGNYTSREVRMDRRYDEFDGTFSRSFRMPGKGALDRKSGQLGVEVAQNMMEDTRHHTALVLAEMWVDWLAAGEQLRNDDATVELLGQELRALERRRELRDAAQLEVDQARAAMDQAEGQATRSRADMERARAMLAANFPDLPIGEAPPAMGLPELPAQGLDALRDMVIARSHEIRAAEREAERLSVVAERSRKDRFADPTVGLRVFSEFEGRERGAGVQLSIPLGGGYRKAKAEEAASVASAANFDTVNVRRTIEATANADLVDARNRFGSWGRFAEAARTAAQAAERVGTGHKLGAIDLADLLLARRQDHEARRMEITARADAIRAILKLQIDSHTIWMGAEDEG
ncbi:MAG: TolC family protein [Novosphingobium sp.]